MQNLSDSRFDREDVGRYGIAILAAVLSMLLRQALSPLLGNNNPYHTAWASVIFVAWYCGAGPAMVTAILEVLGVWYWFLLPTHSFALQDIKG
jgi:K+-sensing histidine kinase KdpD